MNTKIVATVGPKTESEEALTALMKNRVDMVGVNFSNATYEQYKRIKKIIDKFNKDNNRNVSLMLDLQGPRIRVGKFPEGGIVLSAGETYQFTYSKLPYKKGGVLPIDNNDLYKDIKK